MTEINRELFRTLADHIEINPDRFDMDRWSNDCGTQFCIAGTICELDPDIDHWESPIIGQVITTTGVSQWVPGYASRTLGLSSREKELLFYPDMHRDDVTTTDYVETLRRIGNGEEFDSAVAPILNHKGIGYKNQFSEVAE